MLNRILLPSFVACLLFLCSCGKKKNNNESNAIWNIGNIQYSATSIRKQDNGFIASNGLNSMQVYFAALPTATRNYKIVDENKVNNNSLTANEVGIIYVVESTDQYLSTGTASDSASVSIEGGTLTIKILSTPVQHYAGGPALDLNTASGVIKTNNF